MRRDQAGPPGTTTRRDESSQARLRAAFERLFDAQQGALLRAARRLCGGNDDEAQDLVQDAAIKAYAAYLDGRFEEGTNARAWMLRILTNGFINGYHRKKRWEDPADIDDLEAEGAVSLRAAPADQPGSALFESTLDEPVERAVAALSPDLRACIELVDIGDMDYAETAATLDVPIGTVRSRLFRARQQLHRALTPYAEQRGLLQGRAG
ncbi:MAG TPA: sigma-70 family RNA polymerase sigma factor [Chthonomonadaceae bacterium]|nr:sigma-70 family RNA polymerase sigma factor [Chthonomonadaceae bacterium]